MGAVSQAREGAFCVGRDDRAAAGKLSYCPKCRKNLSYGADVKIASGCSKRPSSKAAVSEEARRTLRYVEPLSDARTPLADFFSSLLELEEVFDDLDAPVAAERQEQRLKRRLLGEGRKRALAVVADAFQ